jgi:hypothetical protein
MAKFHINLKGDAGECKAKSGTCPFGAEDKHFGSPEAARTAFEETMKQEYTLVNAMYRKDVPTDTSALSKAGKERMLREAAEGTSRFSPTVIGKVLSQDSDPRIRAKVVESVKSQKIINSLGNDEARQVRIAVAAATNNTTLLRSLVADGAKPVRDAAGGNTAAPKRRKPHAAMNLKKAGMSAPAKRPAEVKAVLDIAKQAKAARSATA